MGIITIVKSWFWYIQKKEIKSDETGKSVITSLEDENLELSTTYTAAGCLFTDGKLVLAGYQPSKEIPCISGLGGSRKDGETVFQTAMRETIEELFDISDISTKLLEYIQRIIPGKYIRNNTYIFIVYNFKDLESLLILLKNERKKSYLYKYSPTTLNELIFNREIIKKTDDTCNIPEISHLCLLPLVNHLDKTPFVDNYFISDLQLIKDKVVNMVSV